MKYLFINNLGNTLTGKEFYDLYKSGINQGTLYEYYTINGKEECFIHEWANNDIVSYPRYTRISISKRQLPKHIQLVILLQG